MTMAHRWNDADREKYAEKKIVPVLLCPPQIPRGMMTNPMRASATTVLGPTAQAPSFIGRPQFSPKPLQIN